MTRKSTRGCRRIVGGLLFLVLLSGGCAGTAIRQEGSREPQAAKAPRCGSSLDLTASDHGVSFGNSCRTYGLRFNFQDEEVEEVKGLNLTLWVPADNPELEIGGLALGLVPAAAELDGLALGLGGIVTKERLAGISLAGGILLGKRISGVHLGGLLISARGYRDEEQGIEIPGLVEGVSLTAGLSLTSDGMEGIHAAGIANVSEGHLRGIFASGLATVARREIQGAQATLGVTYAGADIDGISVTGLVAASQGSMSVCNISGLVTVAQKDLEGVTVSGLTTVAQRNLMGTSIGGFCVVAGRQGSGIHLGGIFVGAGPQRYPFLDLPETDDGPDAGVAILSGVQVGGLWIQARDVRGVSASSLLIQTEKATGICLAAVNSVSKHDTGLSLGLFNYAGGMSGVQVGLLNYIAENPAPFKLLPILNFRFD